MHIHALAQYHFSFPLTHLSVLDMLSWKSNWLSYWLLFCILKLISFLLLSDLATFFSGLKSKHLKGKTLTFIILPFSQKRFKPSWKSFDMGKKIWFLRWVFFNITLLRYWNCCNVEVIWEYNICLDYCRSKESFVSFSPY